MLLQHPQWLRAQWHVQSYWSLLTQSGVAQQPWQQQYKETRKSAPVTVWGAAPVFLFLWAIPSRAARCTFAEKKRPMKTAFHWFLAAGMLITGSINTLGALFWQKREMMLPAQAVC